MNKNKKYIIGVSILLVSLITIGISYAYWMLSLKQEDKNIVTSDCFKITFTGENDINLTNAYPMHDDELYTFYQNATPYHFTITNTCESHASGFINLETLSSTKKLADNYVDVILYEGTKKYLDIAKSKTESTDVYSTKGDGRVYNDINIYDYSLKGNPVNPEKVLTDSLTAYKLHEFTLSPLETKEYNLLEYMSPDTPPIDDVMNATFESKITVTTSYQKAPEKMNKLRARVEDSTSVFQNDYVFNATSISFENTMNAPTTYIAAFDESAAQDGSIMAYVIANESDTNTYTIKFQTDGKFLMPEDSSWYFSSFVGVIFIEGLENVDTSNVTNMESMFASCYSLTSLNLSSFDTSNVTNMEGMFYECLSLTNLDLSNFDSSNATNMLAMFAKCTNLASLDLSNFDTSNVTTISSMFSSCSSLTSIDLSNFNTSNVTDMHDMFSNMTALTNLDLTNFDTRNVTNISYMFQDTTNLTSVTYGTNFIRKESSDITNMYTNCPANKPTDPSWDGAF